MDAAPYTILLWIVFTEGQSASLTRQEHLRVANQTSDVTPPPEPLHAFASTRRVTRISPVPLDAPLWKRNELVSPDPGGTGPRTLSARRVPDYMEVDLRRWRTASRRGDGLGQDSPSNHKPYDSLADYEIVSPPVRRQPFPSLDSEHEVPGSDELVLDESLISDIHKHDGYEVKPGAGHGRGPIIVRGPGFNSVAIGFLVYLILLSVLQNSIFNISRHGLLGLGPLRDRERRDMEAGLGPKSQRRLGTALEPRVPPRLLEPVLVAAVLDSDPDPGKHFLSGPRRARRSSALP